MEGKMALSNGRTLGCTCMRLRKASRRMSQFYDAALAPAGLRSTQFSMLAEIERRAQKPPTIGELADVLVMDQSTIEPMWWSRIHSTDRAFQLSLPGPVSAWT